VGTTSYFVTQTVNGCESPKAKIDVIVNPEPAAPAVVSTISYCLGATATALTATGSNLLWYSSANGTGTAAAPTPSTGTVGNTYYYVSQTVNGCESPKAQITVAVSTAGNAPQVTTPVVYCQGATATALSATGANLKWYATATGGTGATTAPTPSTATTGTTSYYVSQSSGGCESPRARVDVTINTAPGKPVITAIGSDSLRSSATGSSYQWFLNDVLIGVYTQTIKAPAYGVYRVVVSENECASASSDPYSYSVTSTSLNRVNNNGINVYPNPTDDNLNIAIRGVKHNQSINLVIYNTLGKQVLTQNYVTITDTFNQQIDLSYLSSGVYYIQLHTGNEVSRIKFVKR
jgi:hypothetical protein